MKRITILGSTGSIGTQTLDIIRQYKEKFQVVGISCNDNLDLILEQIKEFKPEAVAINNEKVAKKVASKFKDIVIYKGQNCEIDLIDHKVDQVVVATIGSISISTVYKAILMKYDIALATKEVLVCAGDLITRIAKENDVNIYPIDSEHSAIWANMDYTFDKPIKKIILTASGGPFYGMAKTQLEKQSYANAIKHPTWKMGDKISLDSATLMNKGYEIIEAMHLFDVEVDKIEVIVHTQSIIHSLIEFEDNTIRADMSVPNMKIPIARAILYPEKNNNVDVKEFDFTEFSKLTFNSIDKEVFECVDIAYKSARQGGLVPCCMCVANDELQKYYKEGIIKITDIPVYIQNAIINLEPTTNADYDFDELFSVINRTKIYIDNLFNDNKDENF